MADTNILHRQAFEQMKNKNSNTCLRLLICGMVNVQSPLFTPTSSRRQTSDWACVVRRQGLLYCHAYINQCTVDEREVIRAKDFVLGAVITFLEKKH